MSKSFPKFLVAMHLFYHECYIILPSNTWKNIWQTVSGLVISVISPLSLQPRSFRSPDPLRRSSTRWRVGSTTTARRWENRRPSTSRTSSCRRIWRIPATPGKHRWGPMFCGWSCSEKLEVAGVIWTSNLTHRNPPFSSKKLVLSDNIYIYIVSSGITSRSKSWFRGITSLTAQWCRYSCYSLSLLLLLVYPGICESFWLDHVIMSL